eukprot:4628366-Amphidinium_carterae.1
MSLWGSMHDQTVHENAVHMSLISFNTVHRGGGGGGPSRRSLCLPPGCTDFDEHPACCPLSSPNQRSPTAAQVASKVQHHGAPCVL